MEVDAAPDDDADPDFDLIGACGLPLIGPHIGRELELMLAGEKPMATFSHEPGMDPAYMGYEFEPYVAAGRFDKLTSPWTPPTTEMVWYCQPGETWRGKLARFLMTRPSEHLIAAEFTEEDLHRIAGFLLGYPQECVDAFCERLARMRAEAKPINES